MFKRALVAALLLFACTRTTLPVSSPPQFQVVAHDPFAGLDRVTVTGDELQGRLAWNLWSGDNAGFWDWLSRNGFGTADLLKVVTSPREERFQTYGITNQPNYKRAAKPDQYGLLIDEPIDAAHDFDRGLDANTWGRSTGIAGLRLFPNPDFDPAKWDVRRYYDDPAYYTNRTLARPYRVGMACSFCHIGPNPLNPPANVNEPQWENLSDTIGAQYFKVSAVFGNGMGEDSFVYQILASNRPGTLDTSFIATDHLNNSGTMNALFEIPGRLDVAVDEELRGGALSLRGVSRTERTPHVLKDGSDSAGFNAALSRVYVNIGESWQEWIRHFNPLLGGRPQSPIPVAAAQKQSPHWNWSETHAPLVAKYFIRVAQPMHLRDAPGGGAYLTASDATLLRGKLAFARHCASCHSSKHPPAGIDADTPAGVQWFETAVQRPDFLDRNFLSSEKRYPVSVIRTNATRALATNATRGHIWDNFSSETYKSLPSAGSIEVWNPYTNANETFALPQGGPGYYRPPSLISVWATAPYLHNNAIGMTTADYSVAGRMRAFEDGMQKLLWPEKRDGEKSIWRTSAKSYITVPPSYIPSYLRSLADPTSGNLRIGPIPKGTPVNLLANADLERSPIALASLAAKIGMTLLDIDRRKLSDADATALMRKDLAPLLWKASKCPDLIEDKGHTFGANMSDEEKRALIEFLKTM
ncbi:MAG TPA: hypothetical protein VFN10_12340 [Thermoanaerobaculia bacterium]|nr:hypothetical protein [Thermoanaerobaculia bacterium]